MATQQFKYNPMIWLDARAKGAARFAFTATTPGAARTWQKRARTALAKCVGFLDQKKVPLRPRTIRKVDRGSYVRHHVVIRTSAQSDMLLYLLVPKRAARPMPCVIAWHGHGYGAKDIVGLWEDGSERHDPHASVNHKDFACALAERGFLVAAPEISCFGVRRRDEELPGLPINSSCGVIANYAFMLGGSAVGMRVWDGMRTVDYLKTLDIADASRLGAMGISGGGLHTYYSAALDQRIKACVISGYFCDWRHSILATGHCECNYVPGVMALGRLSDLAGLIAPRPCLVEAADHDDIFPFEHVKKTVTRARRAWKAFGASKLLQTDYFEGRHVISGAKAYEFLGEHLKR